MNLQKIKEVLDEYPDKTILLRGISDRYKESIYVLRGEKPKLVGNRFRFIEQDDIPKMLLKPYDLYVIVVDSEEAAKVANGGFTRSCGPLLAFISIGF